jgi:hypothetical protein
MGGEDIGTEAWETVAAGAVSDFSSTGKDMEEVSVDSKPETMRVLHE